MDVTADALSPCCPASNAMAGPSNDCIPTVARAAFASMGMTALSAVALGVAALSQDCASTVDCIALASAATAACASSPANAGSGHIPKASTTDMAAPRALRPNAKRLARNPPPFETTRDDVLRLFITSSVPQRNSGCSPRRSPAPIERTHTSIIQGDNAKPSRAIQLCIPPPRHAAAAASGSTARSRRSSQVAGTKDSGRLCFRGMILVVGGCRLLLCGRRTRRHRGPYRLRNRRWL